MKKIHYTLFSGRRQPVPPQEGRLDFDEEVAIWYPPSLAFRPMMIIDI